MTKIYIHFHNEKFSILNPLFYSTAIIKFFTNDIFYHVSIEINNIYYEANFFSGVIKSNQISSNIGLTYVLDVDTKTKSKIVSELNALIGAKYDYLALLSGFFGKKIQSKKAYFCSEICDIVTQNVLDVSIKNMNTNPSPKDVRMILTGAKIKTIVK